MTSYIIKYLYQILSKKVTKIILILFLALFVSFIFLRGPIVKSIIDKKIKTFSKYFDAEIKYSEILLMR